MPYTAEDERRAEAIMTANQNKDLQRMSDVRTQVLGRLSGGDELNRLLAEFESERAVMVEEKGAEYPHLPFAKRVKELTPNDILNLAATFENSSVTNKVLHGVKESEVRVGGTEEDFSIKFIVTDAGSNTKVDTLVEWQREPGSNRSADFYSDAIVVKGRNFVSFVQNSGAAGMFVLTATAKGVETTAGPSDELFKLPLHKHHVAQAVKILYPPPKPKG